MVTKIPTYPEKAIPALAAWVGINYALVETGKSLGLEVGQWFGVSPAGYAGSPHLHLVMDVAAWMKDGSESEQGRMAKQRVLQYPLQFVPASGEIRNMVENWDKPLMNDDGTPTKWLYHALGFKTLKPGTPTLEQLLHGDIEFGTYAEHEMGISPKPLDVEKDVLGIRKDKS
jgi:hypothetical protein